MNNNVSKSENQKRVWILVIICAALIIMNGFQERLHFKVDTVTFGLLVLCSIPMLQRIVTSVKAGGVELQFREYSVHQQIFLFLDGVAAKQAWTFYTPRKGETELGQGFKVLIDDLVKNKKKELIAYLEQWLENDSNNHKWFAAEVIGYAKIDELKNKCKACYENLDVNDSWEPWQLNCLWAYARFYEYKPLASKLQQSDNEFNIRWMLASCKQMIQEEDNIDAVSFLQETISSKQELLVEVE